MTEEHTTFIYRLRAVRSDMLSTGLTEHETAIIEAHGEYLDHLAAHDIIKLAGRTLIDDEHAFGIVVLEADSDLHARRIMNEDPAVANGVLEAELFPFRIAVTGG